MNQTQLTTHRRPTAMVFSGLLHGVLALLLLRATLPEAPPPVEYRTSLVFAPEKNRALTALPVERSLRLAVRPQPPILLSPMSRPQLLAPEPSPAALAVNLPAAPVPASVVEPPRPPILPSASLPAARVTGFDRVTESPASPSPKTQAKVGLFGTEVAGEDMNAAKVAPLRVGEFAGGPRSPEYKAAQHREVAAAGFAGSAAPPNSAGRPVPAHPEGASASAGLFGSVEAGAAAALQRPVANTQFDAVRVSAGGPPARAPANSGAQKAALEILHKPAPVYTDEARRRKLEGEVILEVLFGANGQVRVLRVLRGLGYGLDENAIRAAANIRFRPATEGGLPADTVATVRIGFQLAY